MWAWNLIYSAGQWLSNGYCRIYRQIETGDTGHRYLYMSRAKRKGVFAHAQNAQIQTYRACAKTHSGICFPLKCSILTNDYASGQRWPRSVCAHAQTDLDLLCPHTSGHVFALLGPYGIRILLIGLIWYKDSSHRAHMV